MSEHHILDESSDYGPLGPCGCLDYHMADCPTRTTEEDRPNPAEYWMDWSDDEDWTSEILGA